ncbi:MAG: hypothetical protein OXG97_21740 [Candidatus Poribacteria bacterium]|nr:hypothetical protein [Candidatus Poribacteria bacterium]
MNAKTSKDNGRSTAETDTNATSSFRQLLSRQGYRWVIQEA